MTDQKGVSRSDHLTKGVTEQSHYNLICRMVTRETDCRTRWGSLYPAPITCVFAAPQATPFRIISSRLAFSKSRHVALKRRSLAPKGLDPGSFEMLRSAQHDKIEFAHTL